MDKYFENGYFHDIQCLSCKSIGLGMAEWSDEVEGGLDISCGDCGELLGWVMPEKLDYGNFAKRINIE